MSRDKLVRATLGIGKSQFRIRDWARESALSVLRHPARSLMTAIGTVLGSAAFVATLGISSTVGAQVSDAFDIRRATEVRVVPAAQDMPDDWQDIERLDRLRQLNGVTSAGQRLLLPTMPVSRAVGAPPSPAKIIGADPGAVASMVPRIVVGRTYDEFHEARAMPVVLLARPVADELGITRAGVAIFVGDRPLTVIGIFDDVQRRPEALLSVIVPASVSKTFIQPGTEIERDVLIATAPGAAQLIGSQSALALWPEGPAMLRAIAPPDPRTLRREIEGNVAQSSLLLSLIALVIGAVSIANAATASITARVPEIGLRRAIGGRPLHIFAQLLGETTALGALGGVVGVLVGVGVTAVLSLINRWAPVLDVPMAVLAVVASAGVGLVAGLWPASRAMRIQPVAALQR